MPIALDDFADLQRRVEAARQKRDELSGSLKTILGQIRADYGTSDLDEARAKLEKLKAKELRLYEAYTQAKDDFERKYQDRLGRK